jgi:hypothetical protein
LTVTNHAREPGYSDEQNLTVFCGILNPNCTMPFRERDPADRRQFSIAKNPVRFRQFYRSVPGPVRDTLSTLWTRAGSSMDPSQGGAVRRTDKSPAQKPAWARECDCIQTGGVLFRVGIPRGTRRQETAIHM